MSDKTKNLGLTKPSPEDFYDINVFNGNMDKIDGHSHSVFDEDIYMSDSRIRDVADPILRSDVATKGFVEDFSIEGSTYVAVDENNDGNIILRPYVPLVDDFAIEDETNQGCYYRLVNGEIEWVNPPMIFDTEYRTTERYNGKVVYVKHINLGACPALTTTTYGDKWVDIGISHSNGLSFEASCIYTETGKQLKKNFPVILGNIPEISLDCFWQYNSIVLRAFTDMSMYTATAMVKYTK